MFERDCTRLDIKKNIDELELFRMFLEDTCRDWYNATLMILTLESEWLLWKQKFCEIFADEELLKNFIEMVGGSK
ncbi:hypothetical protein M0802_012311 [Mischocyttarus mexicanus]|nr:hypothetical protein M0802_012311 [Mischocyttarus mexicanus]